MVGGKIEWLGQQDSNLHSWYQKPESYHWTMAQFRNIKVLLEPNASDSDLASSRL